MQIFSQILQFCNVLKHEQYEVGETSHAFKESQIFTSDLF